MSSTLVAPAPKSFHKSFLPEKKPAPKLRPGLTELSPAEVEAYDEAKTHAARLLAQGHSPTQVAKALGRRIVPLTDLSGEELFKYAAKKVRAWCRDDQAFRDLIWHEAVVVLDLKAPLILNGVAKAAQRGRVDAARLALELTGRVEKDQAVTNVTVQIAQIPRPE